LVLTEPLKVCHSNTVFWVVIAHSVEERK